MWELARERVRLPYSRSVPNALLGRCGDDQYIRVLRRVRDRETLEVPISRVTDGLLDDLRPRARR